MPVNQHIIDLPSGVVSAIYHPGREKTVVLIHGNSARKETFAPQFGVLQDAGHGVLAIDLPGHGQSGKPRDPEATYSFPGYAGVVAGVLDHLSIAAVHVVGWSLGGHIGLELMGRDPRVRSLLIYGTPAVKLTMDALTEAFLPSPGMNYASQRDLAPDEAEAYAQAMGGGPGVAELCQSILATDGDARVLMFMNAMKGFGLDAFDLVEADPRPLAVLHGDADPFINLAYLRKPAYRNLWRGAVQVMPGVGHAAHRQATATFNELMLDFLRSAPEDRAP
jgi:pimeloyl-ACP methyl ester carboxylesterase